MNEHMGHVAELLKISLSMAVPLVIEQLRAVREEDRLAMAQNAAQYIAEHGDDLVFKFKTKGKTGKAFGELATGLAAAAFQPGGVKFLGLHFEVLR